jgi:hypothetical protein
VLKVFHGRVFASKLGLAGQYTSSVVKQQPTFDILNILLNFEAVKL